MPPSTATVRVVLVNYRSAQHVRARLTSAALRTADVVVVDNASEPDEILRLCEEHGATALLLDHNAGFAGGVNAALDLIKDRPPLPLLLLNPDAELEEPALATLLARLEATGVTGVGPLLVEPSGRLQVGAGGGPVTLSSVAAYFLFLSHLIPRLRGIFLTRRQSARGGHVTWLCMACLLLRPDAVDRYGTLPEDELVYAEDVAWGTRASADGARFLLVPEAQIRHDHGASGGSDRWAGALARLLRRRLSPGRGLVAVAAMRVGLGTRRLVRAIT